MSISLADLQKLFPTVDAGLVQMAHEECRGNRLECISQLQTFGPMASETKAGPSDEKKRREDSEIVESQMSMYETEGSKDFYDDAVLTGEAARKARMECETAELMQEKMKDIQALVARDNAFDKEAARQREFGPQSQRGGNFSFQGSGHNLECFKKMIQREREHCGEFVVFYHSYSFAELLYEVQSVIAENIYGLEAGFGPMARLLKAPFEKKPHLSCLLKSFKQLTGQDHDPNFRALAISVSVALVATASEAPPMQVFENGYSCNDLSFNGITSGLFQKLGATVAEANQFIQGIIKVGNKHKIHTSGYGAAGEQCFAASEKPGHMLQIFVRADCVDDVAYGSLAYGVYQDSLNPLSKVLRCPKAPDGQARVFWHPTLFMDKTKCIVYHYAAQPSYQRLQFRKDLLEVLLPLMDTPKKAMKVFRAIEGIES